MQGLSAGRTILVTPLFFGLAHVHHLYEYVVHQRRSLATALFAVSFNIMPVSNLAFYFCQHACFVDTARLPVGCSKQWLAQLNQLSVLPCCAR